MPLPETTLARLLTPGFRAVGKYWKPFLLLQSCALLLVVGYYTSRPIHSLCERLSQFKQHAGLIFIAIAAAFSGGLLPELAKAIVLGDRQITRRRIRNVTFALAVFALSGIITDFQYRGIAWLLGSDTGLFTVVRKALFDQFVTTPIYGTPYWVLVYLFRANRYSLPRTARQLSPHWYVTRVMPLLIPGWCFWIPMVTLIYSLPGPLQFCLFCFAAGTWSLLMVFIASDQVD